MLNDKNKFRFWNPQTKAFVTNYNYNGPVDQLFEPDEFLKPQQFLGILDKNMKEIYEGDVVNVDYFDGEKTATGVIQYNNSYCAYVIDSSIGVVPIMHISLDSLEIIGNMIEDYMWNEEGTTLIKDENAKR
jgi:uncharacterized phage protein (TIGR01671 family)